MLTLFFVVAAYLLGSISFAVVTSRAFGIADPRTYGSGNPGATNVLRSGKKLAAALTLLGDALRHARCTGGAGCVGRIPGPRVSSFSEVQGRQRRGDSIGRAAGAERLAGPGGFGDLAGCSNGVSPVFTRGFDGGLRCAALCNDAGLAARVGAGVRHHVHAADLAAQEQYSKSAGRAGK
jgi:hypothetical protein